MKSKIRSVYLYIFAMLGLVLLVIGGVGLIDMALKAFVFTGADEEQRIWARQPPQPHSLRVEVLLENGSLSEDEMEAVSRWLDDYRDWEERVEAHDPVKSNRQRSAANNLALIIVGLPLYLYHWNTIKKESKN